MIRQVLVIGMAVCYLMGASSPAPAQTSRPQARGSDAGQRAPEDQPGPERMLVIWTRALRLSDAQVAAIRPLLEQMFADVRLVLRDRRLPMGVKRERIRSVRLNAMAQVRTQLGSEQAVKFDAMQRRVNANN